jgi:hypothetical protein
MPFSGAIPKWVSGKNIVIFATVTMCLIVDVLRKKFHCLFTFLHMVDKLNIFYTYLTGVLVSS